MRLKRKRIDSLILLKQTEGKLRVLKGVQLDKRRWLVLLRIRRLLDQLRNLRKVQAIRDQERLAKSR